MTPIDPESVYTRATAPILGPEHTYASVTDKISAIVLVRPTTGAGFSGMTIGFGLDDGLARVDHRPLVEWRGHLGDRRAGDVGLRDRQLRLVDRHRPCRHFDLGDSALAQARLADLDQPIRRGDDAVRRRVRGLVSALAPGAALALLLADSLSQHDGALAAVAQPLGLGRVCRIDLCHRFTLVLVRRA